MATVVSNPNGTFDGSPTGSSEICLVMSKAANGTWHLPYICDDKTQGRSDGMGLLCNPFWDFDSGLLVLVFLAVWVLRFKAIEKARIWKHHLGMREANPSDVGTPFVQGSGSSPRMSAIKSVKAVGRLGFKVVIGAGEITVRVLLQVCQWWVVMSVVLIWELLIDFLALSGRFWPGESVLSIVVDAFSGSITIPPTLQSLPHWLALFSMYSFVALFIVYSISLISILVQVLTHTLWSVVQCKLCWVNGWALVSYSRDVAIQVLLLPIVYSLLAGKSVQMIWLAMSNEIPPALECYPWTPAEQLQIQDEVCEANFALADAYEAWALYCFGIMISKLLHKELRKVIKGGVIRAFQDILLIDVRVFVLLCGAGAVYNICITWFKWRLGIDICKNYKSLCLFQPYLVGANWVVSSVAIYNLYTTERRFEHLPTMKAFHPSLKFWSIKIMVIISFWMSFLMAFFQDMFHLTGKEAKLLDACLRIYVMAGVSVINLVAWWPWTGWYRDIDKVEEVDYAERDSHPEHLMDVAVDRRGISKGAVDLAEQLLNLKGSTNWDKVEQRISEMTEHEVDRALHKGSQLGWVVPTQYQAKRPQLVQNKLSYRMNILDLTPQGRKECLLLHVQSFFAEYDPQP
eukprot:TRINITY_DN31824_c0_g1_i1.p1 TRINITY_DN31824_c0_g1~~TRINITY_DN31824_c0_g1_i1.p1  ORF type:complete len:640 (+),score=59.80 TRINITY_DN31824_c0_g1_i1:35-1921(+)